MNRNSQIWLFSIIFIVIFTIQQIMSAINFRGTTMFLIFLLLWLIILITWIVLMFTVYKDAKEKGLNENLWLLVLFFGPLGAIIYWAISKSK